MILLKHADFKKANYISWRLLVLLNEYKLFCDIEVKGGEVLSK